MRSSHRGGKGARRTYTIALGMLVWACVTQALELPPVAKELYLKYCSACHGEAGKGDGVVSGFLRPKPPDLTQLAKQAGGKFPFVEVMKDIDGTTTIRAHGDSDMPVWGESFRHELRDGPPDDQVRVRGRLMLITEYIESIQAKQ